jgi:hypothetical protein
MESKRTPLRTAALITTALTITVLAAMALLMYTCSELDALGDIPGLFAF